MIEIDEAKEGAHILNFLRGRPGGNTVQFHRVHGDLSRANDYSKVFHFLGSEGTFLKFQMKIYFGHALEYMFASLFVGLFVRMRRSSM